MQPIKGIANLNPDNTITYDPGGDFTGTDSFTYTANDGDVDSNIATVTVTVKPVNNPPMVSDDNATTNEDTAVSIDVLANDTDADGDLLTVSEVTQGAYGSVTINDADNTVTYTPDPGFTGHDTFTYILTDGKGGTDTATVSITVNPSALAVYVSIEISKQSFWIWCRVTAVVIIKENDASGLPLEGATVKGHWSDAYSDTSSGNTDKNGKVYFETGWIRTEGTITFTVDKVVENGQEYNLSGEIQDSITGS